MRPFWGAGFAAAVLAHVAAGPLLCQPGPFDGKNFHGRIAYSADGNHNDEDDWAASPVALAIFAEFGVTDKLVHFDYNAILNNTDPKWEKIHEASVLGAVERYGYDRSRFYDDQKDVEGAIESIARAINASSADDPLFFIIAGPMEVAYRGIQKAEPEKRKYVFCISHSRWNDGFAPNYKFNYNKRSVIPSGVKWVQIQDQNAFLAPGRYGRPSTPEEWSAFHWMRDSDDEKVRFLWQRLQVTRRADCSDAGMAYFLMTGDERSEIEKLRKLLDDKVIPAPIDRREYIRIEAENFLTLDGFDLDYRNDPQVSHRISVRLAGQSGEGRIRTPFEQPYTAIHGLYDVDIRYFDEKSGQSRLAFYINGAQQGDDWRASADDDTWRTHTISGVDIHAGDEIMVALERDAAEPGKIDYVQLNDKRASPAPTPLP
jgi:hypothetical protein